MWFHGSTISLFAFVIAAPGFLLGQSGSMGMTDEAGMAIMEHTSGTNVNPVAASEPMIMLERGGWSWMFMGEAFVVDTQQAAPRGGDKLFSVNWFMIGATHNLGKGSVMIRTMLSLEPATITDRRYPELFQTGETAYGMPIVNGQHPHNFVMGFDITYAHPVGEHGLWEAYYAPVGDPALGPVAFPHRASAAELPQAPIGHHWEDSTHIAYNVATTAFSYRKFRLEASGFHGMEPGENRWTITSGEMDSWAARASVTPNAHWMAQVSTGRITHPEALEPGDVIRTTASIHYSKAVRGGDWSSSVIWGRNHETFTQRNGNAYTAETVYWLTRKNILTGRAELVDKDELFPDVAAFDGRVFRIGAYTLGYSREISVTLRALQTAIGANVTAYTLPGEIKPYYGNRPWGVDVYLRVRLKQLH